MLAATFGAQRFVSPKRFSDVAEQVLQKIFPTRVPASRRRQNEQRLET